MDAQQTEGEVNMEDQLWALAIMLFFAWFKYKKQIIAAFKREQHINNSNNVVPFRKVKR